MVVREELVLEGELKVGQRLGVEPSHLAELVGEEAFQAEQQVLEDPWTDALYSYASVCLSASLPRYRLHLHPAHCLLEAEGCCCADETSWRKASSVD